MTGAAGEDDDERGDRERRAVTHGRRFGVIRRRTARARSRVVRSIAQKSTHRSRARGR